MVNKTVHLLELFSRVVFQQMFVVFTHFNHAGHLVDQFWWFKLAVGFFTQVEDRQTRGQILVIRCIFRDQISRRFDDGFVNISGFDAVIELDV
ncbi:hypothetical protein SRABI106_02898 [Rahnella aquatilis]|nr:hypothetical protein SRABI106_02898 [Rahnella aquatilis]